MREGENVRQGSICTAAIILLIAGCNGSDVSTGGQSKTILGYYTGESISTASVKSSDNPVTAVSMDQYDVDANGNLHGGLTQSVKRYDDQKGRDTYICVSNFGATDFDPVIGHGALVTNRETTVANLVALVGAKHPAGINIDFEGIYPTDRDAYTAFVIELSHALHAAGASLMLSVPAKASDDPSDDWSWPYNYKVIGQYADVIQVMTYDEHVPGDVPGPVAGSDWMKSTLTYAASQIAPDKILLGLPAYGYDWDTTDDSGVQVDFKGTAALLQATDAVAQYDDATQSAFFDYTAMDGHTHEVWYDTAKSIQLKAAYAKSMGLGGVSMWALGFENGDFWKAVEAGID